MDRDMGCCGLHHVFPHMEAEISERGHEAGGGEGTLSAQGQAGGGRAEGEGISSPLLAGHGARRRA